MTGGAIEVIVIIEDPLPPVVVEVADPAPPVVVEVAEVGLVGPAGPVRSYPHHQTVAAAQWTVAHNLGTPIEPTILLDTEPTRPVWTDVEHVDGNTAVLIFPAPVTGWAYF